MTRGTTGITGILAVLLTVGCLGGPAAVVCAQQTEPFPSPAPDDSTHLVELDNDHLLVLEVRLDRTSSGHGLLAYQYLDAVMLPIGEITSVLELAVMVDAAHGVAEGWIVDESRTFRLDVEHGTIEIEGDESDLPPGSAGNDGGDLYLRSDLLQRWLPVDVDINFARMNVTLLPREILPFQDRRQREEQRALWLNAHGKRQMSYPLWVAPYRLLSWPMTDATLDLNSTVQGTQRRFSSQSWADIAGLSSNLFLTHVGTDDASRTTARLKAGRWDTDGRLLGRIQATRYEFGDLDLSRIPLISATKRGLGFTVSNQDLHRSREFDTTDVRGDAPPGWEAELYINGTLYDFQTVDEDGRYSFTDVPMVVGNNTFRTVLYGPRGEKRTVMDHANISPEMTDVGELKYTATTIHEGASLLTDTQLSPGAENKPWNHQLELSYAFSNRSAVVADFSSLSFAGERDLFSSLTSHNSLGPVNVESILAASTDGGQAASLAARTSYRGQNILVQTSTNDEYKAESPDGFQFIRRQTVLRSSGNIMRRASRGLIYGLSSVDRQYTGSDLRRSQEFQLRLSGNQGKVLLAHTLSSRRRSYVDHVDDSLIGTLLTRTWIGPVSVRGDVSYEVGPTRIRSASATATAYSADRLQATVRLNHYLSDVYGNDGMTVQVTRLFDHFTLGANLNWYENIGTTFGITLGTFLARDNRSNTWASTHRRLANRSAASVRTFIDLDNDGVYDDYDMPLEGVGFMNLTAWRDIRTNANGIALLPGVVAHRPQTIELDMSTVDDPFLIPVSKGASVLGHPGGIVDVELPFAYAGEMEGRIVDAENPELQLRHVGLELLDRDGERVASTVAEFDGFYYIADIMPGTYDLHVIPSTINTRVYEVPESMAVIVPGRGGYVTGPDVVLKRKKKAAPADTPAADAGNPDVPVVMPRFIPVTAVGVPSPAVAEADTAAPEIPVAATAAADSSAAVAPTPSPDAAKAVEDIPIRLRLPRDRGCTGK